MKDYLKTIKKFNDDDWQRVVNVLKLDNDFAEATNITFQNIYTKVYDSGVFIAVYSIYRFENDKRATKCKTFFFDEFNCYSVVGKEKHRLGNESEEYVKHLEGTFGKKYRLKYIKMTESDAKSEQEMITN